jgi:hypothetical protein
MNIEKVTFECFFFNFLHEWLFHELMRRVGGEFKSKHVLRFISNKNNLLSYVDVVIMVKCARSKLVYAYIYCVCVCVNVEFNFVKYATSFICFI